MSSTSFLYHAYGLKGIEYVKTNYKEGRVYFTVQTKESQLKCSNCESSNVIKKGVIEREFRALPIGMKEVVIVGRIQRLECKDCGLIRQEKITYADQKKHSLINLNDMPSDF